MSHCPAGHDTTATDYCDVCGLAVVAGPAPSGGGSAGTSTGTTSPGTSTGASSGAPAAPAGTQCPHCQAGNPANALFCEACGYDFTTGSRPRGVEPVPSAPAAVTGSPTASASSSATPADALAANEVTDPAPANPAPAPAESWVAEVWIDPDWYADQKSTDQLPSPGIPVVVPLRHTSVLIGRASVSRGIQPDLDLSSDTGISRRHAQLSTDGRCWFVEDLDSSNGTYVGSITGPLPAHAIAVGKRQEIGDDDRIYLGAWTRLVVRRATPGEF